MIKLKFTHHLEVTVLKIVIFDEFDLVGKGISSLLSHTASEVVAHSFSTWPITALERPTTQKADVILLELGMINSAYRYNSIKEYTDVHSNAPICIFTRLKGSSGVKLSFEAGVKGFLHKSATLQETQKAIQVVASGGTYLPPDLFDDSKKKRTKSKLKITPRQKEILNLLSQGDSNKIIADKLGIDIGTVKQHFHLIFKALGAKNRVEALQTSIREDLID